jgi:DNA-binding transcriptional MocR family regulator
VSVAARHVPVNATALIRGMFHGTSDKPQLGVGMFPPSCLQTNFMPAADRRACSGDALQSLSLQYGEPAGDCQLRKKLSSKLVSINVIASPSQIITIVGAPHALDIVSRTLLHAGDCVMVEEPGWAIEFVRLAALGMRTCPCHELLKGLIWA